MHSAKYSDGEIRRILEYGLKFSQENKDLKFTLENQNEEKEELEKERDFLTEKLYQATEEKNDLKIANTNLRDEILALKNRIKEIEENFDEIKEKRNREAKKNDYFQSKVKNSLTKENKELKQTIEQDLEMIEKLKKEKQFFKDKYLFFHSNCVQLNEVIKKMEKKKSNSEEKLLEKEREHQIEINKLKKEFEKSKVIIENTIQKNKTQIKKLKSQNARITQDLQEKKQLLDESRIALMIEREGNSKQNKSTKKNLHNESTLLTELDDAFEQGLNNKQIFQKIVTRFQNDLTLLNSKALKASKKSKTMMEDHFNLLVLSVKQKLSRNEKFKKNLELIWCTDTSNLYEEALEKEVPIEFWYTHIKNRLVSNYYEDLKALTFL